MTDTGAVVAFLQARLDEAEAIAREAIVERERVRPGYGPDTDMQAWPDAGIPAVLVGPERVLTEVVAKRQIIREWRQVDEQDERKTSVAWAHMTRVLWYIVLPFADHPDYRDEWRP